MRGLINYIRSCFCKHEWEYEEQKLQAPMVEGSFDFPVYNMTTLEREWRTFTQVSITCKKCGYHRSYEKF